jgi:hypothetical protein
MEEKLHLNQEETLLRLASSPAIKLTARRMNYVTRSYVQFGELQGVMGLGLLLSLMGIKPSRLIGIYGVDADSSPERIQNFWELGGFPYNDSLKFKKLSRVLGKPIEILMENPYHDADTPDETTLIVKLIGKPPQAFRFSYTVTP